MGALDRFQLGPRIGDGAVGPVYEARDTVLRRTVALERIERGGDAGARVLRAARAQARLTHPNVVTVLEAAADGDAIVIVTERVRGEPLRAWLAARRDWREIVDVLAGIGRGLAAAHARGVTHGDVTAANVVIDPSGTPKLGEFGLAAPDASPRDDVRAFAATVRAALADAQPPARVRALLARGDRIESIDRWVAALSRARRGRGRAIVAAAAIAIVAGAAASAWLVGGARDGDPCPVPRARLDRVWGDARRGVIAAHARALDPAGGAARVTALAARLDPYVRAWSDMRVDACRASRVRHEQADAVLDRRMRCLDRRLDALDDGLAVLAGAGDRRALDRAIAGLAQLAPLDGCADPRELAAASPLPTQPAVRAAALALERELDDIEARHRGGALDGLPERARAAVARARALGDGPTLSAALAELSRVSFDVDDLATVETTLRELTEVAARARVATDEAQAWTGLIDVIGRRGDAAQALALVPAASAAVARAGEPVELRVNLLYAEAIVLDEGPRPRDGLVLITTAAALLDRAGANRPHSPLASRMGDVLFEIANAQWTSGDELASLDTYRRAIALYRELYGPDSLDEAYGWSNLGQALQLLDRLDEAVSAFRTAVRIREARLGDSPALAFALVGLAVTLGEQGHADQALPIYDRVLAMSAADLAADSPARLDARFGRAGALEELGRDELALREYDDAIAGMDARGGAVENLGLALANRGALRARLGRCDDALADDARAIDVLSRAQGDDAPQLASALIGQAECLLTLHRAADAIAPLERIAHLRGSGGHADVAARARFELDRALVESGRDPARGLADARAARDAVAAAGARDLAEVDRWLARHHVR